MDQEMCGRQIETYNWSGPKTVGISRLACDSPKLSTQDSFTEIEMKV